MLSRVMEAAIRGACKGNERALRRRVENAAFELSRPEAPQIFDGVVEEYGETPVALAVASTIMMRPRYYPERMRLWAQEALAAWTPTPDGLCWFMIADGLHPAHLAKYADALIRGTSEEESA